jgi:hypothetical protein
LQELPVYGIILGCVRLLTASGTWSPIFDAQSEVKGLSDYVWPISVNERPAQQLRYIYCKGSKYPLVASRPTPLISAWKLALCDQVGTNCLCVINYQLRFCYAFLMRPA